MKLVYFFAFRIHSKICVYCNAMTKLKTPSQPRQGQRQNNTHTHPTGICLKANLNLNEFVCVVIALVAGLFAPVSLRMAFSRTSTSTSSILSSFSTHVVRCNDMRYEYQIRARNIATMPTLLNKMANKSALLFFPSLMAVSQLKTTAQKFI